MPARPALSAKARALRERTFAFQEVDGALRELLGEGDLQYEAAWGKSEKLGAWAVPCVVCAFVSMSVCGHLFLQRPYCRCGDSHAVIGEGDQGPNGTFQPASAKREGAMPKTDQNASPSSSTSAGESTIGAHD